MKIDIKNKKKATTYIPKLKDLVQNGEGRVGLIYLINIANRSVKVAVMTAFEDEEGTFDHSKVICEWSNKDLSLFEGTITISN